MCSIEQICYKHLPSKEDDLDLMVSPNHSLERRTDNQAAKTDIMRELLH